MVVYELGNKDPSKKYTLVKGPSNPIGPSGNVLTSSGGMALAST